MAGGRRRPGRCAAGCPDRPQHPRPGTGRPAGRGGDDRAGDAMTRRHLAIEAGWALVAAAFEVYIFLAYRAHEARFHWFTHFFVGASVALVLMAAVAWRTRRPV